MELQKRIDHLIDVEGYTSFALQDKNIDNKELIRANCVIYPTTKTGYKVNSEDVRRNLVSHVLLRPGQIYRLFYSRQILHLANESELIDTRTNEDQTSEPNNENNMDERSKEEKRSDELYIREIMSKNGFLESEVERLKDKIDELEAKLEDAEAEADENKHAAMADATTSTIGQVVPVVMQMAEKYFSLQQQKNDLLAEQMRRRAPQQPQNPNLNNQQTTNGTYYETEN